VEACEHEDTACPLTTQADPKQQQTAGGVRKNQQTSLARAAAKQGPSLWRSREGTLLSPPLALAFRFHTETLTEAAMRLFTVTVALATALAPMAAGAAETAVVGGAPALPPASSAGPNAGLVATPDEPVPPAPPATVGQAPGPNRAPVLSRNPRSCNKTICANSNGGG
jgi:hypothetical protein